MPFPVRAGLRRLTDPAASHATCLITSAACGSKGMELQHTRSAAMHDACAWVRMGVSSHMWVAAQARALHHHHLRTCQGQDRMRRSMHGSFA